MKIIKNIALVIFTMAIIASCQNQTDIKQTLSNTETRKEIMASIAGDSTMYREMMDIMLNGKYSNLMKRENHEVMMKMMKQNHKMATGMMSDMMKSAEGDTSMMSAMCNTMMGNQHMKVMMNKKMQESKNMKKRG